ncbi:conserved Plasmodium protein, unknown function [Plasmodium berghei]|uniref:Uncharacterized protein n=2 Tax=Plasmodium berghei TaxID=5821 RepID=A0A509AIF8_PLABA|nr:conserved Plasmodium protein, unknown function [Plasmodium berghei ANKA]CXI27327.1 conserved Plasmodium protein, unknown function [Plasmodium berghei]SCM20569.1 conserved Plasmodium protein, unknown function [Plasmodium berghei]SCN24159.1 conserved Plasmodium protein, unknown function [Plasmodium berghei]SCO59424.1 conserved Plasmodium protein, unknown function [Plasmodium berghei]SCO60660.1 conserved Plasmodium protein, unknown function [Plasmodium berghei]|eukprot:XP_034420960.1 conserved Plasmodium protein, unknown function [Plasmodium berghei ANKA]
MNSEHNKNCNDNSERSRLVQNEFNNNFLINSNSRVDNNNSNIYYTNQNGKYDNESIFGSNIRNVQNDNLKTFNLNDINKESSNNSRNKNSNFTLYNSNKNIPSHLLNFSDDIITDNINESENKNENKNNTIINNLNNPITILDTQNNPSFLFNDIQNNSNFYKIEDFEKEHNFFSEKQNNTQTNIMGKMNIINLSAQTSENNFDENNENTPFGFFPLFKKLNNIRTKLLHFYDIDNDIIIYRCMCALFPYCDVDKKSYFINNFDDIEQGNIDSKIQNTCPTIKYATDINNYTSNGSDNENYDENENIRNVTCINDDAVDYYDNKLNIIKNPDLYGFIWLNIFISFIYFFIFNLNNTIFNTTTNINNDYINRYIYQNKLNVLYNTLFSIYLFNVLLPVFILLVNYFITKKKFAIKLLSLISLASYNNIILLPLILIYKFTIIDTTIPIIQYICSFTRLLLFIFYVATSLMYIYKFTIKIYRNNFSNEIIYFNYFIFTISYISLYFMLKSYVFNYL